MIILSHKKWIIIYFSILTVLLLIVPVFNYYIDSSFIFNNKHSASYAHAQESIELLQQNLPLRLSRYHAADLAKTKILHFLQIKPDPTFVILGTSQVANINEMIIGESNIFNAAIAGGEIGGIISMWEEYKKKIKNSDSQVILEIYLTHSGAESADLLTPTLTYIRNSLYPHMQTFFDTYPYLTNEMTDTMMLNKRISYLHSLSYFMDNLNVVNDKVIVDHEKPFVMPNGSYNHTENNIDIQARLDNAILIGKSLQKRLPMPDEASILSESILISLLKDMEKHGVKPIFLLSPLNPITYDLATQDNEYYLIVENWLREYALAHNIEVLGSYNPHEYNLSIDDFFDAYHPRLLAWKKIFENRG
ncbi:hypothetical protein PVA45_04555 [Entomospira entomophila]|uniref:Uncharacterized protein n=1 Tax=Entomospira entomophila TaxID=2719988 RepID=A0A968GA11_9SPIO|nr:hypothetical protein [Entomospira entomophilus]NIZ40776.1 hypothetical protein [Entomospira entomophilus]WDI34989.1 hypothetical protein PVA45_04555 [Entomospira entomophilus]